MCPSGISPTGACCKEQTPVLIVCREMLAAGVSVQRVWVQELGERVISHDILAQTPPIRHRLHEWLRAAEHQPSVMSTCPVLGQGGDGAELQATTVGPAHHWWCWESTGLTGRMHEAGLQLELESLSPSQPGCAPAGLLLGATAQPAACVGHTASGRCWGRLRDARPTRTSRVEDGSLGR